MIYNSRILYIINIIYIYINIYIYIYIYIHYHISNYSSLAILPKKLLNLNKIQLISITIYDVRKIVMMMTNNIYYNIPGS